MVKPGILRVWRSLRPATEAHRGALWAAMAAGFAASMIGGFNLKSGFGLWVDLPAAFLAASIGLPLITLLVVLALTLVRKIPRLGAGVAVAVVVLLALPWLNSWGYLFGSVILLVECTLGASLATVFVGGLRYAALGKRTVAAGAGGAALFANVWLVLFLHSDGINQPRLRAPEENGPPAVLAASDPSLKGEYKIATLVYGHGDDVRRTEYGKSVAIRTQTVNATPFFPEFGGWRAKLRKVYWGFGMDALPLNARVWYPVGTGPFPLVLMVHGNHEMSEFSDSGYGYLGELLASRGFIFVSIDENFLNSGLFHEPPDEKPARAWLMLEHLKLWEQWNAAQGNPFYGKIDTANVALMGHSRGGAAALRAALYDRLEYDPQDASIRFQYGYPIKAVVAIAPAGEAETITDVNYLTIQGAQDADVSTFQGSEQWDRVHLTGRTDYFKSELYIYGANHGQFNTVWGRHDSPGPKSWFLNMRPLLSGEEQRKIAEVYIAGFLEATLRGRDEYRQMFRDYRTARNWLPGTVYLNRYSDSSNRMIADFSEDSDLTTTTLPGGKIAGKNLTEWHEDLIPFRDGDRGYNGVFLGWNSNAARYSVTLPNSGLTDANSVLSFSIAVTDDDAENETTDFSVLFEDDRGGSAQVPVSRYRTLRAPIPIRLTKIAYLDHLLYKEPSEPVFQTVEIPLKDFTALDVRRLKKIELLFDRTPASEVLISQMGLMRE